ncbi:unnamed protein product [Diatraea saccharalis]|uniref:Carboxylesterase type B domain-containing protein n=1 Tax=Diatraea saccharalis TaxID=40085 RepID=A0A9N9R4R1_9NEOP|nr:unnamed protein product [Diatraea saccharalis]
MMRWKILWLITALIASEYTKGVKVKVARVSELNNKNVLNILRRDTIQHIKAETDTDNEIQSNNNKKETVNNNPNYFVSNKTYTKDDAGPDHANLTKSNNVSSVIETIHSAGAKLESNTRKKAGNEMLRLEMEDMEHKLANGQSRQAKATELIVETDIGKVKGHVWQNSDEIISYLDIPYGRFTLFEAPVKANKLEEVHSATEHTKLCPQIEDNAFIGNTECLTLSIFALKTAINASVLFYIHDHNSNTGSGNPSKYGPEFLVKKGIILVLPNYRLGALGFLCLQNDIAPGNAALKDLGLALEWTKNNIKKFGGNPSNIVISGDGQSSALAGLLALSSDYKQHINKVISESGAVLSHWAIDRNPIRTANQLAEQIQSTTKNTADNVFDDIEIEHLIRSTNNFILRPCIEKNSNGILKRSPWAILNSEAFNMFFMIGSANHAGLPEALQYDKDTLSQLNEVFDSALPNDLVFPNDDTRRRMGERIRSQYFGTDDIVPNVIANLSLYHTDVSFLSADLRLARALVAAGATVYLYEFSFMGEFNNALQSIVTESRQGAIGGDVTGYLFSKKGRMPTTDSKEEKVVEKMTDLWVNFINKGSVISVYLLKFQPVLKPSINDTQNSFLLNKKFLYNNKSTN